MILYTVILYLNLSFEFIYEMNLIRTAVDMLAKIPVLPKIKNYVKTKYLYTSIVLYFYYFPKVK
jgi:hypothetical protein